MIGRRWGLSMNTDGTLRANTITPTWGGGGLEVMPVTEHEALRAAAQAVITWADSSGIGRDHRALARLRAALSQDSGEHPNREDHVKGTTTSDDRGRW
jgi:hypothetical protein